MATIYAGDTIVETVITQVSGDTITAVYALKPNGSTFTFTQAEIGTSGDYAIQVVTDAVGWWRFKPQSALNPGNYASFAILVESAEVRDAIANIGAGRVTVVSPVAQDGTLLHLVRGDDYLTVDGRQLEWTTTDAAAWPTLTGASVALHLEGAAAAMPGSVVTPTGSAKKVRVELTDTMTAGFTLQRPLFQVVATLANADVVTLVAGRAQIAERIAP